MKTLNDGSEEVKKVMLDNLFDLQLFADDEDPGPKSEEETDDDPDKDTEKDSPEKTEVESAMEEFAKLPKEEQLRLVKFANE